MTASVLVVDDQLMNLRLFMYLLRNRGFEVVTATSAESAIEMMTTRSYDVVLTDLVIPGKTGIDVIEAALAVKEPPLVIAMTGVAGDKIARRAEELLGRPPVSKLLGPSAVVDHVEEVLGGRQDVEIGTVE